MDLDLVELFEDLKNGQKDSFNSHLSSIVEKQLEDRIWELYNTQIEQKIKNKLQKFKKQ